MLDAIPKKGATYSIWAVLYPHPGVKRALYRRKKYLKKVLAFLSIRVSTDGVMKTTTAALLAIALVAMGNVLNAQTPYIVSPNGQYLGNLSANRFDPNSVSNPYGQYGSAYSPTSINNKFSPYGNPYSPQSVNNPYATQSPVIYVPR